MGFVRHSHTSLKMREWAGAYEFIFSWTTWYGTNVQSQFAIATHARAHR